ncbi:unnamed protein product [Lathyrus oleraceus]
MVTKLKYE